MKNIIAKYFNTISNSFTNLFNRLRSHLPSDKKKLIPLILIILAIPLTIVLALTQQDSRSRASGSDTAGYDIIIVAGQSNAQGAGMGPFTDSYANPVTDARIFQLGRYGASNLQVIPATRTTDGVAYDLLEHWDTGIGPLRKTMGFSIPFARRYIQDNQLASGRQILIIPAAYGSTSILKWLGEISRPPTTPNALYDDMLNRTRIALALPGSNKIVAVLWSQGETDVSLSVANAIHMSPNIYAQKLTILLKNIRTDFPSDSPYPIISNEFVPAWLKDSAVKRNIEAAKKRVFKADIRAGVVEASGLEANYPVATTDPVQQAHFTSASQVKLGNRYYQMWKQLKSIPTPTPTLVPCIKKTPGLSVFPDKSSVTPGGKITYSITVTSQDEGSCQPRNITFATTMPSNPNWRSSYIPGPNIVLPKGGARTINLEVTSPIGATAGTKKITITAKGNQGAVLLTRDLDYLVSTVSPIPSPTPIPSPSPTPTPTVSPTP